MDEKSRFILAIVLCVAIFFIFSPPRRREQDREEPRGNDVTQTARSGESSVAKTDPVDGGKSVESGSDPETPAPAEKFERKSGIAFGSSKVDLELSSEGARVVQVVLTDYNENDFETKLTLLSKALASEGALTMLVPGSGIALDRVDWDVVEQSLQKVVFRYPLGDGEIRKTFLISEEDPYLLTVGIETTGVGRSYELFGPAKIRFDPDSRSVNGSVSGLGSTTIDRVEREDVGLVLPEGRFDDPRPDVLWSGLESNYFAFVIRPIDVPAVRRVIIGSHDAAIEDTARANNKIGIQGFPYRVGFSVPVASPSKQEFEVFLGPKDPRLLAAYEDRGYPELVYYGDYLGGLVRLFLMLMRFFEGLIGSWGVAIICLTFVVKLLLHPINKRNQGMMQRQSIKMKDLQPKMDKLKEQHKNDPARATREIQQLMREENVNPLALFGGCLLIFLQLPIWIGLISTFTLAIELRHQPFLYIADLTQADHLFHHGIAIPLLGEYFNLLPVLYVILTLVNQKMMPKSSDPQMQSQQKMMTFMIVAFGFIFYGFSSGLLVYFITSAALGIFEQRLIRAELKREGVIPA